MKKRFNFSFFIFIKLILLAFLFMGCSSLLYYPRTERFYDPEQFHLRKEDVYFKNQEGQKLHGWWFPAKTSAVKGSWIYFHGNAENISSHFTALSWLPDAGYNYFIFDYPGFGESEGSPDPYVNVISGKAALQWVHDNKDQGSLIIYGQSMGGIVALRTVIEMKDQIPMKAVIADGTFSSFQRIARKKLQQHWLTWLAQPAVYLALSDRWAPDIEKVSPLPLIVMHGEDDHVVELEHGLRVFEQAKEPKKLIVIPTGGHGNLFWVNDRQHRETILEALEDLERPRSSKKIKIWQKKREGKPCPLHR